MYNRAMLKFTTIFFIIIIFIYKSSFGNTNKETILKYLQDFNSLNSKFIQINNNGEVLSGKILILRPGKVRIEYREIPLLLISDGKKLASINKELKSITFYNLNDIPVNLFLYKNFKTENVKIMELYELENQVVVKFRDKKINDNFIEIIFEAQPFQMKKWTIFEGDYKKTEVLLDSLVLNENLNISSFTIDNVDPRPKPLRNF